jgi:hypothetical protein
MAGKAGVSAVGKARHFGRHAGIDQFGCVFFGLDAQDVVLRGDDQSRRQSADPARLQWGGIGMQA